MHRERFAQVRGSRDSPFGSPAPESAISVAANIKLARFIPSLKPRLSDEVATEMRAED
jgi:hypothetical protein